LVTRNALNIKNMINELCVQIQNVHPRSKSVQTSGKLLARI